jgi:hypothetical protein
LRHVLKVRQRMAILVQDLINQVESKIIDLIISGICHPMPCLKTMSQVITYAIFELVPELIWSRGFTVGKDDHKETVELRASLHSTCFLEAFPPLFIILQ